MSYETNNIPNLRVIKARRGEAFKIDLGKEHAGSLESWMKKDPNASTYRSFEIRDNGRCLYLSADKASDYTVGEEVVESVAGKWYFDVEQDLGDGSDIKTIYRGTIVFQNDITNSGGTEGTPPPPSAEVRTINVILYDAATESITGSASNQKEVNEEVVTKINELEGIISDPHTADIYLTDSTAESISGTATKQNESNEEFKTAIVTNQDNITNLDTGDIGVAVPSVESLSGLAISQAGINIENKTGIEGILDDLSNLKTSGVSITDQATESLSGAANSQQEANAEFKLGVEANTTALDSKVDDVQVLTDVPAGAVFTDTQLTDTEVKEGYERNANTNAFTDAEKSKLSSLEGSKFLGEYISLAALQSAHPAPEVGSYANVDQGIGEDVVRYIWDDDDLKYVLQLGESTILTDAQIKQQYENNPDTNAFTDSYKGQVDTNTLKETNVTTDLSLGTVNASTLTIASSDGTDVILPSANTTEAGLLPASMFNAIIDNTEAIGLNTTHRGSDGSDHGFIDQDVTVLASPEHAGLSLTTGNPNPTHKEGLLFYDNVKKSVSFYNEDADITVNWNETLFRVYNGTTETILNGKVVTPDAVTGISLADNRYRNKCRLVAMATHDIEAGSWGYVARLGELSLDTTGLPAGSFALLGINGNLTLERPTDGGYEVIMGIIDTEAVDGLMTVDINISHLTVEVTDTNGFPRDQREGTLMIVDLGLLEFSINPTGTDFHFYELGEKYESTGDTVTWTDVEGEHWFYFNLGVLTHLYNPSSVQKEDIILNHAFISAIYWDATNKKIIGDLQDERHGIGMSPETHLWAHLSFGSQWNAGYSLGDFDADGDGADASAAQFSVSAGIFRDEDIAHVESGIAVGETIPVLYNLGASGDIRQGTQTGFAMLGVSGSGVYYNEWTGTEWQISIVPNRDASCYHIFGFGGQTVKTIAVMGQVAYTSVAAARNGASTEISNLISQLPFAEMIPVATVVVESRTAYTNAVGGRIRTVDGENYISWTATELAAGSTPSSHSNLTNVEEAGLGIIQGHITDQAQEIHGVKTFADDAVFQGAITANTLNVTTIIESQTIAIEGNLYQTRLNATLALDPGVYTGIEAHLYDGVNDGQLVFDYQGFAYVGDKGDLQKLATRNEASDGDYFTFNLAENRMDGKSAAQTASDLNYWKLSGTDVYRATGNVGVGIDPTELLHLYSGVNSTDIGLQGGVESTKGWRLRNDQGNNRFALSSVTGNFDTFVERLTVTEDGNVGIGTNTPTSAKFQVLNSDIAISAGYFYTNAPGNLTNATLYANLNSGSGNDLIFRARSFAQDRFVITGAGNVGIGTNTPTKTFEVNASDAVSFLMTSNGKDIFYVRDGGAGEPTYMSLYDNNIETVRITGDNGVDSYFNGGNVGIGADSPIQNFEVLGSTSNTGIAISRSSYQKWQIATTTGFSNNISISTIDDDGTNVANVCTFAPTGEVSFDGTVTATGYNIGTNGSLYGNSFWGQIQQVGSGTSYDYALLDASTASIMSVPTGTRNVEFGGTVTATGLTLNASSVKFYSTETGKTDWRFTVLTQDADTTRLYNFDEGTTTFKDVAIGGTSAEEALLLKGDGDAVFGGKIINVPTTTTTSASGTISMDFDTNKLYSTTLSGGTVTYTPTNGTVGHSQKILITGSGTIAFGTGVTVVGTVLAVDYNDSAATIIISQVGASSWEAVIGNK